MKQIWGHNAAGPSGYTKEIGLFLDEATARFEFRVRPSIAAPEIVIPLSPDAICGLETTLRDLK